MKPVVLLLILGFYAGLCSCDVPEAQVATSQAASRPATQPTTMPAARQGQLQGQYVGVRHNQISGQTGLAYLAFYTDGTVMNVLPHEGMAGPPDLAGERNYGHVGRYEVRGEEVHVTWESGDRVIFARQAGGQLRRSSPNRSYRPLPPLNGLVLDGTWEAPGTGADAAASITFHPDGSFGERGLMKYTSWAQLLDGERRARQEVPGGSGRYTIGRNTLELTYENGPTARMNIFVPLNTEPGPKAETIFISGSRFSRAP